MNDIIHYSSLSEVAAQLDIHPFDVARYLALQKSGIPNEMQFSSKQITQIAEGLGLENWWKAPRHIADDNPYRLLIREMAQRLLNADLTDGTRADNLYRGLQGGEYSFVRSVVNAFIKSKILHPVATLTGLQIHLSDEEARKTLKKIVSMEEFPSELEQLLG
jgi:hypothetical protein